ncbi:hypothetical protein K525DRAFT_274393 [Schizophyllum commune Loenen D]|nr:hypothetical protein K525DRAFT_274393 [Schizophyllum commune Loenen D]
MVSFLLRPNAARFPLFAASVKHNRQWGSVNAEPAALDAIDPGERFVPYRLRGPSIELAFFNPGIPWEGYMPDSLLGGQDPLAVVIRKPSDDDLLTTGGGDYRISKLWQVGIGELAVKVEGAFRRLICAAEEIFYRVEGASQVSFTPFRLDTELLHKTFRLRSEVLATTKSARAQVLANVSFLAWFTHVVGSWAEGIDQETADFVRSLRLEEREMRGYIINLPTDYCWLDLQLLIEHEVPFHYLWSPCLHLNSRFMRTNPWLIARVLEMKRQLGREPTDEEVLDGQGRARTVLGYDRFFQPRDALPEGEDPWPNPHTRHAVQFFRGWHEHDLKDEAIIRRALQAYEARDPAGTQLSVDARTAWTYIYRWARKGANWVEDDELEDWEIFETPAWTRRGTFFHGRELRRLTCAPLPHQMLEHHRWGTDSITEQVELQMLVDCIGEPVEQSYKEMWDDEERRMPTLSYDSRAEGQPVPDVPLTGYFAVDGDDVAIPEERDERPSLLQRMEPLPEQRSLAERMGLAVAASGRASSAGSSQSRGRARGTAASRTTSQARRRSPESRSASPPRARRSMSIASSAAGSSAVRDYTPRLPDPSTRWGLVTPASHNWGARMAQHIREADQLLAVLSAPILPRAADVEGRIRWADRVIQYAYLVLLHPQHQVRVYALRIKSRRTRAEDFLKRLANAGIPLAIAFPQSMYPTSDQDRPIADEEAHSVAFVPYGVGGTTLFNNWKSGLRSLARKPNAAALYFSSDIASYVLRRWAWDILEPVVGNGPSEDARVHRSGDKYWPAAPLPALFTDEVSSPEIAYAHGCIIAQQNGESIIYRYAFPPKNSWASHWPTRGEWGVEENKYMLELAVAFERGEAEIPMESAWRDRLRNRSRSNLGSGFRKSEALSVADAEAWAEYFQRVYGGDRRFVRIADLGEQLRPARLYE